MRNTQYCVNVVIFMDRNLILIILGCMGFAALEIFMLSGIPLWFTFGFMTFF
jgi:hypothetical protein